MHGRPVLGLRGQARSVDDKGGAKVSTLAKLDEIRWYDELSTAMLDAGDSDECLGVSPTCTRSDRFA